MYLWNQWNVRPINLARQLNTLELESWEIVHVIPHEDAMIVLARQHSTSYEIREAIESAPPMELSQKVMLTSFGAKKIQTIKVVRELTGLGLKEAKTLVESCPTLLKEGLEPSEAQYVKERIEEAGGTVKIL